MRLGMAHVAMRQMDTGISAYEQALEIQNRIEDRRGQAMTLDKIGEFYSLVNQPALAIKNYQQALERWGRVNDAQGEALSLYGIARVDFNQNRLTDARDRIVEVITKVESLRTMMTSYRLRMSYYAAKQDFFELEIDTRMRLYDATRSRAELESALLCRRTCTRTESSGPFDREPRRHSTGVDPQLLALERTQRIVSGKVDAVSKINEWEIQ